MATNTELKNQIDSQIKNKTAPSSITKSNVADNMKQIVDYVDQEISTMPTSVPGPTGQQGIQGNTGLTGPQGDPGPIGPAGLTWKGQWVSGFSYLKDDAVGHNGASWFCINATSGTTPPNADVTNWALLASQGAQGIQGATGLTGSQGPAGNSGNLPYQVYTAYLEFVDGTTITSTVLENTIGDGSKDGINDIKWTYNSAAQPKATMTTGPFTANKTLASNNIYNINENLQGFRMSSSEVRFYSNKIVTGSPSLSFVPFVFVEIKVYN